MISSRQPPMKPIAFPLLAAVAGTILLLLGTVSGRTADQPDTVAAAEPETALEHAKKHQDPIFVCPMHPQVVRSEPGNCPICGMNLVAKAADASQAVPQIKAAAPEPESALEHARKHQDPSYVCPMHPQVVRSKPGNCPICGMNLVAKAAEASQVLPQINANAEPAPIVTVSDAVVNQLGVRTAEVHRGTLIRHLEGSGVVLRSTSMGSRPTTRSLTINRSDQAITPTQLLVLGQVFEREAPLVFQGQKARVSIPGLGAREWMGTVSSLESQVSQTTHTFQFRVTVDNEGASVPGGMTAVVTLEVDPVQGVLLVPREAVIVTGKGARVIVALDGGRFQQRKVDAEDLGEDEIVIRSGLREGERVVVSAQFLLDSEANLQAGLMRLTNQQAQAEDTTEEPAQ